MKHLSDEQLGARLDGELPAKQADEVERHLAACAECRDRLAALSGSHEALARSLGRDPGERYFETFADRVQARIAAGATPARAARAGIDAPARGGWLTRPSTLVWAGATAALVAVGAFAYQFAMQGSAGSRAPATARSIVGADRAAKQESAADEVPAPASGSADQLAPTDGRGPARPESPDESRSSSTPSTEAAPPAFGGPAARSNEARQEADRANGASSTRRDAPAAPQRLQELRTLPGGEQVPVTPRAAPPAARRESPAPPPGDAVRIRKPLATPLTPAPTPEPVLQKSAEPEKVVATRRFADAPAATSAPPAPAATPAPAAGLASETGVVQEITVEAGTFRLCGTVRNTQGRAVPGATVTVVETGRAATADASGAFCVDAPSAGATLAVLSLGYEEYRASVNEADAAGPYAVALRSVDALGTGVAISGRLRTAPAPDGASKALGADVHTRGGRSGETLLPSGPATVPPVPGETPEAKLAREATEAAMRVKTVPAWSRAGALWTNVAAGATSDAVALEARFRAAEARMNAWRLARGSANRRAALDAVEAYLAKAPAGEQRRLVEAWRRELPER